MFKPELLSPAGSLEKLKVAISYGADAVYLAGQKFGLRTAADNFTLDELVEGVGFARNHQAQVYVVLNGFLHDKDLEELPQFLGVLNELKVDAFIASDLGVIETVKKNSKIPIHLSTQASCLNRYSAKIWQKMGVKRLIFGREVHVKEAGLIKKQTGMEVELFIHGSMCMSFSGHCTISNYTQGRDSNRGGCAQSCRFNYSLDFKNSSNKGTQDNQVSEVAFMSSKDLNGLEALPLFFEHEIDSLKIEGRMRSPLYAGVVSKIYREAIDTYAKTYSEVHKDSTLNTRLGEGPIVINSNPQPLNGEFSNPHAIDSRVSDDNSLSKKYLNGAPSKNINKSLAHELSDEEILARRKLPEDKLKIWEEELSRLPHRTYSEANLVKPAGRSSVHDISNQESRTEPYFLGLVRKVVNEDYILLRSRVGFGADTPIEVMSQEGENIKITPPYFSALGKSIDEVKPNTLFRIPYHPKIHEGQILRKQKWL